MTLPERFQIAHPSRHCAANDYERARLVRTAVATVLALHLVGLMLQVLGGGNAGILVAKLLG